MIEGGLLRLLEIFYFNRLLLREGSGDFCLNLGLMFGETKLSLGGFFGLVWLLAAKRALDLDFIGIGLILALDDLSAD